MVRIAISGIVLLLGLLLTIVVGLFAIVSLLFSGGRLRWFSAWREVSGRYHGSVDSAWWLPRLRFRWRDQPLAMRSVRRMAGLRLRGTVIETTAPEVESELVLQGRSWPGIPAGSKTSSDWPGGDSDNPAGNPLFRDLFVIVDPGHKRSGLELLQEAVVWQMIELAQWSGQSAVRLEISRNRIRILRANWLRGAAEADDFLRLSLRVIDQLRTIQTEGLQFVNEDQATILDDVFCPICTDRLEGNMVICVRCKTPHCRECWEYNGKCAMFACTESRYVSVGR